MPRKVLLVGHCGPDESYLKMAVKKAVGDVEILSAEDSGELAKTLQTTEVDLILFNRELGYGFDPDMGVEKIRLLRAGHPNVNMMLISNYPDAQQAAVAAGALPGFGKREIGTAKVTELLRNAAGVQHTS